MSLILKSSPQVEPMEVDEVRAWHRLMDDDPSDAALTTLIVAARERAESYLRKRLITQTVTLLLDCFEGDIHLPVAPVQEIAEVRYRDGGGTSQVLPASDYRWRRSAVPNMLVPSFGNVWPVTIDEPDAVEIDLIVGFGPSSADVPAQIRQAMFLHIGHLIENRSAVTQDGAAQILPMAVSDLLDPHRLWV